ncbi:hypothetical protein KMW28_05415 [Flammeovirga yaeyamensis]|uniref:Uncharacterized protein n=1 Tax=Flammeovirga yaeyamensis TaxID=367791 RepID=A0AAX1N9V0_9BACT|nr:MULTISPECIES: hypothetical protein [Flammeovirga]ANQ49495.1 hypothetical protein MY04_2121 [Flammeovirga sp. MY04]MBB3697603.1 hypothetical protein [Flammeovirga yaeyamensis]NMF36293.1 hypothetical protein [Flammeovirga yaeyamensis]QWG03020.1 hypothetical protein KMW28_05415 [Flammeovirga yaeyamensis]
MYLAIGIAVWSFYQTFFQRDDIDDSALNNDDDDNDNNGGWPVSPNDPDLDLPPGIFILPPGAPDPSKKDQQLLV